MRIDASTSRIGIGTDTPGTLLTLYKDGTQASSVSTTYQLQTVSNSNGGIAIQAGASSTAYLVFGDNGDYDAGKIAYHNSTHHMDFYFNGTKRIEFMDDGQIHWGSGAAHGVLSWDTGRAIVGSSGSNNLDLKAPSGYAVVVNEAGSNVDFRVEGDSEDNLLFVNAGTDNVIIGHDTAVQTIGQTAAFQVLGTGNGDSHLNIGRFSNNTSAPMLSFTKSRSGTIGTSTVVQDGDACGTIGWAVADGTDFESYVAAIGVHVDGSPGGNDTPGRIEFNTTADGSAGSIEAMRLDSSQDAHFDQDVIAFSTTPSDIRLKKNFTKIENGLDVVLQLEGHTFNWKKERNGERLSAGFKAQEVEKILPHLVDEKKLPLRADDDKEYKILRYEEMIPYLVEAIKEQQEEIELLKANLDQLKYNRR